MAPTFAQGYEQPNYNQDRCSNTTSTQPDPQQHNNLAPKHAHVTNVTAHVAMQQQLCLEANMLQYVHPCVPTSVLPPSCHVLHTLG